MTIQSGANLYTQGFGSRPESVEIPVISPSSNPPTYASNAIYPIGTRWINESTNTAFVLTSISAFNGTLTYSWEVSAGGSAVVSTFTADTGTATPAAGVIHLAGTANEITTTASGNTVTISIPSPTDLSTVNVATALTSSNMSTFSGATSLSGTLSVLASSVFTGGTTFNGPVLVTGSTTLTGTTSVSQFDLNVLANSTSITIPSNYNFISVNTTAAPVTLLMPATPTLGQMIMIADVGGAAATNNINIDGNTHNFTQQGFASTSTIIVNANYTFYIFVYNGTTWSVK